MHINLHIERLKMSTTANATQSEILHLDQFKHYLPGYNTPYLNASTLDNLARMGALQVSTLQELAIANLSGWLHQSLQGRDFADGSDAKYATCRQHSSNRAYGAKVGDLHNKRGDIRLQVLNVKGNSTATHEFFWFIIPYSEYQHITTHKGNLEIPFLKDGTPNKHSRNKHTGLGIWRYQVPDFTRMAISNSELEAEKRRAHGNSLFTTVCSPTCP